MILSIFSTINLRSKHWKKTRDAFIKINKTCAACGTSKNLHVHHIEPFHVNPSRELDTTNLIVLCATCHLVFGHLMDYSSWNTNVLEDAKVYLNRVSNRPYSIKGMSYGISNNLFSNIYAWLSTQLLRWYYRSWD